MLLSIIHHKRDVGESNMCKFSLRFITLFFTLSMTRLTKAKPKTFTYSFVNAPKQRIDTNWLTHGIAPDI